MTANLHQKTKAEDYTRSFANGDWRFRLLASSGWDTTIPVMLGLDPSIHDSIACGMDPWLDGRG